MRTKHIKCRWVINFTIQSIIFIYLSMALQPLLGSWPLFSFLNFYTVIRTVWTGDQPVARPLPTHTGQHEHRINAHRHPCLEWESNPRSRCSSEDSSCFRLRGHCDRQLLLIGRLFNGDLIIATI
jgi:hypothetical protein